MCVCVSVCVYQRWGAMGSQSDRDEPGDMCTYICVCMHIDIDIWGAAATEASQVNCLHIHVFGLYQI